MLVGAIIGALLLNAFADTQVLVLDIVRASEVLDQINEDTPGAFDDWINLLEAETDKFTQLVTHLTAGADVPSVGARKKIQFGPHSLKGICLVMGVQTLRDLFAEFERDAKTGSIADVTRRIAECHIIGAQSVVALQPLSANHRPGGPPFAP